MILTAVDQTPHYVEGVKVFLASLAKNAPKEKVKICCINWKSIEAEKLIKINSNCTIILYETDEKSAYVRNYIRHELLLSFLDEYEQLAWLDNDIIVRGPLDGLWKDVGRDTIKIWYRPKKKDNIKFQGGVYVIGNGKRTQHWLDDIIDDLEDEEDWYSPQTLMYKYYMEWKLNLINLEEKYNDSKFKKDSIIWHCKSSHFDDPKYQKEYRKYLDDINTNYS